MFTQVKYISDTMAKAFDGKKWVDYCPADPTKNHYSVNEFIDGGGEMPTPDPTPVPTEDEKWETIRLKRDSLLTKSDWTQVYDSPLKDNQAWLDYRQALRDLPQTYENADDVVFPNTP